MLGELPVTTSQRAYYKLEDVNDSSGNARTLTNENSIVFGAGRFTNGADFGSTGNNKRLIINSNVWNNAMATPANSYRVSFWFKLNVTTSANANARFFTSLSNGTGGFLLFCGYSISGGNMTITAVLDRVVDSSASITITSDTNWHFCVVSTNKDHIALTIDTVSVTNTGSGVLGVPASSLYAIGNTAGGTGAAWAIIDEMILSQTDEYSINTTKYYTQAKGRFCI